MHPSNLIQSGMSAPPSSSDALAAHGAGVQAVGQHVHGADEQMPQGGADEAAADAEDGELLGYVAEVDFHFSLRERNSINRD